MKTTEIKPGELVRCIDNRLTFGKLELGSIHTAIDIEGYVCVSVPGSGPYHIERFEKCEESNF